MQRRTDPAPTWHDARDADPMDGDLVIADVAGRYRPEPGETPSSEQDFWLVLPMHFRHLHPVKDTDQVLHNRYVDADAVVRRPFGADGNEDEVVTHWAGMPTLPGVGALELTGASVSDALAAAQERAGPLAPEPDRRGATFSHVVGHCVTSPTTVGYYMRPAQRSPVG
jgi:hypothetical protein